MARSFRKKSREYVLERFKDEDPDSYFKYKSHGLTQDQLEFVECVENQRLNAVKSFLDRGLDPNYTILPERKTPLHVAIKAHIRNDTTTEKVVRTLLYFGSDPNVRDGQGLTPLHIACRYSSFCCVEALIQAGADVVLKYASHDMPLMLLCASDDPCPDVAKLLIDNGAEVHQLNEDKQNVLHLLCKKDNGELLEREKRPKIVEMLLENGVSTTCIDSYGKTPLCYEILRLTHFLTYLTYYSLIADNPSLFSDVAKVAFHLIRGGGMQDFDVHMKDLMAFIGILGLFERLRPAFNEFFISIQNVLSFADYEFICKCMAFPEEAFYLSQKFFTRDLRSQIGGDLPVENRHYKDVARTGPLSLLISAKNVIRRSLGGRLMQTASGLGLPRKMETYVKCLE